MGLLFSKVVAQFLLPPAGLILLGCVGLAFYRRLWGRICIALSMALLATLSIEPVRDALVAPLETQYPPLAVDFQPQTTDVLVLLGGGLYEHAPEYAGRDSLNDHALNRTLYAAAVAHRFDLPIYTTGGKNLAGDSEAEGIVMRRVLQQMGIPQERVRAEVQAANTWENAVLIRKMLKQSANVRVILVTSACHMPRAVWCFRRQGLAVVPAPADYMASQSTYDLLSFIPHGDVLADSSRALHEYLGLLWYHLKYG